ncbi:class A beta-lactamase [Mycobacterium sp.]|uniref:class A beta-lactamase n=1 Tax=Mycobacterium sp. TaxID=1785 RepID=UPI002C13F209|nr:class A beta-lactamase [Mycobacterium sp.]HTQ20767.1 class A beta-lactamase [Mycobacterium sp.]
MTGLFRRQLLAAALLVPLAGWARPASGAPPATDRFAELERQYGARLGVYVPAGSPTAEIAYRADERFAFCSTFKAPLVAAVLQKNPLTHLDTVVTYTRDDIRSVSPVTEQHVETGMTIGQLCDAAIRYSDGTAANLLLADIGGTAAFTAYLRSLGDNVSRLDQQEPELNRDAPNDERDTTTPRAIALVFQQLVLGDALPPDKRTLLTDWMAGTTTGAKRIRAGFAADWKVADKTGSGDYGRANDVAVVWSPTGVSHVVAILTDRAGGGSDAEPREALIAAAAGLVAAQLISP